MCREREREIPGCPAEETKRQAAQVRYSQLLNLRTIY